MAKEPFLSIQASKFACMAVFSLSYFYCNMFRSESTRVQLYWN